MWYNIYKGWIDSMKIISDIRLYKSSSKNEFGSFITESFGSKKLISTIKRIVMKLRENNFSLGEFDHLYINFTTCDIANEIELSDYIDKYHPWYRYCNIKVDVDLYNNLDIEKLVEATKMGDYKYVYNKMNEVFAFINLRKERETYGQYQGKRY